MRYLRKLALLAAMAMAAMAFMASTASADAQETVEVSKEPAVGDDTHCLATGILHHLPATGNCRIRIVSETNMLLFQHNGMMMELLFSSCGNVFEASFNEDGVGVIYNQVWTAEGGACGREPCDEGENTSNPHRNHAWAAEFNEPVGGVNQERLVVDLCLYSHNSVATTEGTTGTICRLTLTVTHVNHAYEISTPAHDGAGNGGAPCAGMPLEAEGHWINSWNANHPDSLELAHHDDL